ncbi:hypothetical protein [Parvularcula dongshanensis]|uniref:VPLPA-CTERM sorting domain-containing protein n=1 Tax=Parvularcula dongshanensis TaxID=1173995 RepID=A0A840HZ35_9PROT|nr:hypothetical protein [Parvularcula dongshanensis]MBB4658106.1 hypothetical protein [Parvularcula dongshanensis]
MNRLLAPLAALACLVTVPASAAPVTVSIDLATAPNGVAAVDFTADPDAALDAGTGLYLFLNLAGSLAVDGTRYAFSGAALTANAAATATSYAFSVPGSYGGVSGLTLSLLARPNVAPTDAASALLALSGVTSVSVTTSAGASDPAPASASIPLPSSSVLLLSGLLAFVRARQA